MKKILVALALAAFASTASATIAGGPHDMTAAPYNGTKGACQYCHAPHLWVTSNIGSSGVPLWNRDQTAALTNYGPTVLGTTGNAGPRSRTCLSCHDATINVGAVNNGVSETLAAIPAAVTVGTDLTNDHPVGVAIPAANTEYVTPTAFPLPGGNVECSSCHEPHSNAAFFLRTPAGDFCGECHAK